MEQPPSKETRVPVNLRIKFRSETIEQFVERYAVDVSRGGIFIRTREPLAVGTQLKFDFQLQDTSPLMAGEGTVVWIREHDPNRAGVTPGMGVRFDKLTPASQPVLDKILADKGKREPSGPNANTVSGKSGVAPLPVRRPSSTFSAVEPLLGAAPAGGPAAGQAPIGGASPGPAANPFAAASPSGLTSSPLARPTQPLSSLSSPPLVAPKPPAGTPGSGALPTLESQSALGRLATGPNLSAFGPVGAPRTKSPVPLPKPAPGDGSGRVTGPSGAPAVPTPMEDSERTQIADGLPEFASDQPTHVGGPALGLSDLAASRAASISATSKRIPTPPPQPKLSLDDVAAPASSASAEAPTASARTTSPDGGLAGSAASRTTSPDGTAGADAAAMSPGRLSSSQPVVGPHPNPGSLASDLAQTVPASARISAVTSAVRTNTPHATPRVEQQKKRPTAIIIGVLVGIVGAAAAGIAFKLMNRAPEETAPAQVNNAAAPAPAAPANTAAPEGAKTEPATANPAGEARGATGEAKTGEAKTGEAKTGETAAAEPKPGEAKPGEVKAGEAKPAEPAAAEAKPAEAKPEAKPADTKVAAAETAAAAKGAKRPRPVPHKKGALAGKADDAASDAGDDSANVVRIISLPTGADVLIDGQAVGKTPFISKDIDPASPHALTVRKEGFDNHEHMVSPGEWIKGKGPGQSLRVTVKLHKGAGGGEAKSGGQDKDDKAEKPGAPATEPAKTEAPPAAETP